MEKDLIEYDELEEACESMFAFTGVTFLRDFGPWKKGEEIGGLGILLDKARIEEYDENGVPIKSCKFTLTAVPD